MTSIRRFLLLLAALVPLGAAADVLTWPTVHVGKGYAGPVVVSVTWADGTVRDVSTATGTLVVYRKSPIAGRGGTALFTKSLTPGDPGQMTATILAADTAVPGTYYAEVSITVAGVTDTWHGDWVTEGR